MSTFPTQLQLQSEIANFLSNIPNSDGLSGVVGCAARADGQTPAQTILSPFGPGVDGTTPFALGSVTKTFTATAYAMLFLGLNPYSQDLSNTPVIDVFPELVNLDIIEGFPIDAPKITFDQLATYSSGMDRYNYDPHFTKIPNPNIPGQDWSVYPAPSFISDLPLVPADFPGSYRYSNLGFALIGMLMDGDRSGIPSLYPSKAPEIGTSYQQILQNAIFTPLGMSGSFLLDPSAKNAIPPGLQYSSNSAKPTSAPVHNPYFPAYWAGGGVVTTADDMMRWLQFSMGMLQGDPMPWDSDLYLTSTLAATQASQNVPLTTPPNGASTCRGWFLTPPLSNIQNNALVFKDGGLTGVDTYITFTAGPATGQTSSAGVFVLIAASGLTVKNAANKQVPLAQFMSNTFINHMINGWPSMG